MPESRIRSVRELRCGVWEVDIIDASRKRLRRRFRAESADGARAAALASLPGPKACTLGEALDRYFEIIAVKGTTKKTIAHYRKECSALGAIAGCAVDSISPAAAAAALESAESRGVSRVRCYRLKTICAAAGRHALAEGLCASNPFSEVPFDVPRPPRKKRPISPAGLKAARALGASGSGHSAAAGSRLLLEKNGRRRDVEHLRSDTNELLRIVGAGCTLYGLRLAHDEGEA